MLNKMKKLVLTAATVVASAVPSFAALDAATATSITTGISGSDAIYFQIGGAILVVMAGIWGFKKVRSLL